MSKIKQLREQHASLTTEARQLLESVPGAMPTEIEQRFDKIMSDADAIEKRIKAEVRMEELEAESRQRLQERGEQRGTGGSSAEDAEQRYAQVFEKFVRFGQENLTDGERSLIATRGAKEDLGKEGRALSVTGGSPVGIFGGYTVPEAFSNQLETAMLDYGPMLEFANVFPTATGAPLPWPTLNDTNNEGEQVGENQITTELDATFGLVTFGAYKFSSKMIKASFELIQDSAFDVGNLIVGIAGERLGRILNKRFTLGNGTTQPQGVITGATLGATSLTQNSISYNDFIDLEHSVDASYRNGPKVGYMLNDNTLKVVRKLKDAEGRPLFWSSTGSMEDRGIPNLINNRPYRINNNMADLGASAKTVAFGNFDKFKIRKVKDATLIRLNERYADQGQVGWFVFVRYDSKLLDAGTHPIKYLQQAAGSP